ncbi:dTMP kinase [Desulfosediminicola ganghwensis]|uniref:dTMP kinase n=1 Tax=Desulfosediminicola ganghwensis TaxID=2569540 RepID=UPI0010AB8B7E|nr:dTMP kinase [Desulfosediminicola ganghwensis]
MKHELPGRLIVFEGIDGTGKTTQIPLLADYLTNLGHKVQVTREPTTGQYGQKIRELYVQRTSVSREEELQLFIADRREHIEQLVMPALEKGEIVLCDRYYLSTAAYQGANGFDPMEIIKLNQFAPEPDIALIFEVSVDTSLERITNGRGEQLNDFEQEESLTRVSRIFSELDLPFIRRINAEKPIEEVHRSVVEAVKPVLF